MLSSLYLFEPISSQQNEVDRPASQSCFVDYMSQEPEGVVSELLFQEALGQDPHPSNVHIPFSNEVTVPNPFPSYLLYWDESAGPRASRSPALPLLLEGNSHGKLEVKGKMKRIVLSPVFSSYSRGHSELLKPPFRCKLHGGARWEIHTCSVGRERVSKREGSPHRLSASGTGQGPGRPGLGGRGLRQEIYSHRVAHL